MTIISITLVLFVLALFSKGFTNDMLLEGGVFLVLVKLINMDYKNSLSQISIEKDLKEIKTTLKERS